jgi:hypothetical protein
LDSPEYGFWYAIFARVFSVKFHRRSFPPDVIFLFDTNPCHAYTYELVRDFCRVLETEGLRPQNMFDGMGKKKRPEWDASPAKPSIVSPLYPAV